MKRKLIETVIAILIAALALGSMILLYRQGHPSMPTQSSAPAKLSERTAFVNGDVTLPPPAKPPAEKPTAGKSEEKPADAPKDELIAKPAETPTEKPKETVPVSPPAQQVDVKPEAAPAPVVPVVAPKQAEPAAEAKKDEPPPAPAQAEAPKAETLPAPTVINKPPAKEEPEAVAEPEELMEESEADETETTRLEYVSDSGSAPDAEEVPPGAIVSYLPGTYEETTYDGTYEEHFLPGQRSVSVEDGTVETSTLPGTRRIQVVHSRPRTSVVFRELDKVRGVVPRAVQSRTWCLQMRKLRERRHRNRISRNYGGFDACVGYPPYISTGYGPARVGPRMRRR